jgi:hypothetical protein
MRNTYKILGWTSQEKGQYVRPMPPSRWKDKVKRDTKKIMCENVDCIQLVQAG